jgi:hypothetical protein
LKLTYRRAFVAIFALHGSVSAQQWKTILVIFHLLDGDIPALNGVALCTIRAHFSLVDVGVAVLAIPANIREDRLDVALGALHFFMHSAKRILGLVVIELRNGADGPPAGSGMAVLARNRQGAVRTTGFAPLTRSTGG